VAGEGAVPNRLADAGALGVRDLTVFCRGEIRVEERHVRLLGPVRVVGDGDDDAAATLTLTADGMVMHRDAAGAVTSMVADGNVVLTSPRVGGTADTLTLDVKRALAVLGSRDKIASIVLDGTRFTGTHLEFDYVTHAVRAWYGEVGPQLGATAADAMPAARDRRR
jgi:hypothetical protein